MRGMVWYGGISSHIPEQCLKDGCSNGPARQIEMWLYDTAMKGPDPYNRLEGVIETKAYTLRVLWWEIEP